MKTFSIFSQGKFIGTSELEFGDPPMGVAFGKFIPCAVYASIQDTVIDTWGDQSGLQLKAFDPYGKEIACQGVVIQDHSRITEHKDEIQVTLWHVPYPQYSELFPEHVAKYE